MDTRNRFVEFARYFAESVESHLRNHATHLRSDDEDVKPSTTAKLTSAASSAIPYVGKSVSSAIDYASNKTLRRKAKEKAYKLIEVIHFYERDKDKFRKILLEAAFDIFDSYLEGFSCVTTQICPLRAMQKLGIDAGFRLLEYLAGDVDRTKDFSVDTVTQGVLKGCSEQKSPIPWIYGGQLIVEGAGSTVRTSEFFEKIPICFGICIDKLNCSKGLGFRTSFPWETTIKHHIHQREISIADQRDVFVEDALIAIAKLTPQDDLRQFVASTIEEVTTKMDRNEHLVCDLTETVIDLNGNTETIVKEECGQMKEMIALNRRQCVLRIHHNTPGEYLHLGGRCISVC